MLREFLLGPHYTSSREITRCLFFSETSPPPPPPPFLPSLCSIILILYGLVDENAPLSAFIPLSIWIDFFPTFSFLLDIFEYHPKLSCIRMSHSSLFLNFNSTALLSNQISLFFLYLVKPFQSFLFCYQILNFKFVFMNFIYISVLSSIRSCLFTICKLYFNINVKLVFNKCLTPLIDISAVICY